MNNFDYNNFDYAIFVDASVDDGMKFDKGSSLCFTTGCFISKIEDIEHNFNVLNEIKQLFGCKLTDELKYSRIYRHRNFNKIYGYIAELKGYFMMHNAFKKEVEPKDEITAAALDPHKKALAAITHTFPIYASYQSKYFVNKKLAIIIDVMKNIEMDNVKKLFDTQQILKENKDNYEIIFRDSKAAGFELIQLADIIAGIFRTFFENTFYKNKDDLKFISRCSICQNKRGRMCQSKTNRIRKYAIMKSIYPFKALRLQKIYGDNRKYSHSYYTLPIDYMEKYFKIIFCDKK